MNGSEVFTREELEAGRIDLSGVIDPDAPRLAPVHPGRILLHDFMEPLGLSAHALALALRVPANRLSAIVNGTRGISPDTALRLAQYFGGTAGPWLRLQARHDLEVAQDASADRIRREVLPRDHAATG